MEGENYSDAELSVEIYPNILRNYTSNTLSYDEDIYDAFSGVIDTILTNYSGAYRTLRLENCWAGKNGGQTTNTKALRQSKIP